MPVSVAVDQPLHKLVPSLLDDIISNELLSIRTVRLHIVLSILLGLHELVEVLGISELVHIAVIHKPLLVVHVGLLGETSGGVRQPVNLLEVFILQALRVRLGLVVVVLDLLEPLLREEHDGDAIGERHKEGDQIEHMILGLFLGGVDGDGEEEVSEGEDEN